MRALDCLEPLPVLAPAQPLRSALPSLERGTPVAIPEGGGGRVVCPRDVVAFPLDRQLCDLPSRCLPTLPVDDEVDLPRLGAHPIWGAVKHDTLVGRVEATRALSIMARHSVDRESSLAWVTREQLMPKLFHDLSNALSVLTIEDDGTGADAAAKEHAVALGTQMRSLYANGPDVPKVDVDLDRLLQATRPALTVAARPATLTVDCIGHASIHCQRWRIESALLNLVLNASDVATAIVVRVLPAMGPLDRVQIIIEDNGPGLPGRASEDLPAVVRSLRGHGLKSVQRQVAALGGRILFGDRRGGGCRVWITLPSRVSA